MRMLIYDPIRQGSISSETITFGAAADDDDCPLHSGSHQGGFGDVDGLTTTDDDVPLYDPIRRGSIPLESITCHPGRKDIKPHSHQ